MATRSSALERPAGRPAGRRGEGEPRGKARPELGVVDQRHALQRARRRQARALYFLSGGVLAAALTVAAAGHAMLAATQLRSDTLQSQLAGAVSTEQNLELRKAVLESPSRVMSLAEHRYKMVAPSGVTYLQPVDPGESVLQAHEAARPAAHRSSSASSRRP